MLCRESTNTMTRIVGLATYGLNLQTVSKDLTVANPKRALHSYSQKKQCNNDWDNK